MDAAVGRLPPESELEIVVMESTDEGYANRGGSDPTPPNHGSVVGPLCLQLHSHIDGLMFS